MKKLTLLIALVGMALSLHAQNNECLTKKEQEIFDRVNELRAAEGLHPFTFSQQLTQGCVEQINRTVKNPDSPFVEITEFIPNYVGIAYPVIMQVASKYKTAQQLLDDIFYYEMVKNQFIDKGSLKFVSMGVAVTDKNLYIYLGEKHDENNIPEPCNEVEPVNPYYSWIRIPDLPYTKIYESEGTVSVRMSYYNWGFINDSTGEMQIPADYHGNTWFTNGLACVIMNDSAALINHQNEIVFPYGKWSMIVLDEKYPRMVVNDNKHAYLTDLQGNILSKPYDEIDMAGNGFYSFYLNDKKGVMDSTGKVVFPPTYEEISAFEEGFYPFQKGSRWGFMDKNFKVKIAPKYGGDVAYAFYKGFSHYSVNNKVGFMDTTGKIILPAIYDEAGMFNDEGHCMVSYKGKFGVIDRSGKYIIPAVYEYIQRDQKDDYWLVQKDSLFGILGNDNQWKLKPEFTNIYYLNSNRYLVEAETGWGIIGIKF